MSVEIRAEIVGTVVRVVAQPGHALGEGDAVAVMESMKMEIPVLSEARGTVASVVVSEGDVVTDGDLIAVLR